MKCSQLESLESRRLFAVDLYVAAVEFPIGVFGQNGSAPVAVSIRNSGTTGIIKPFSGRLYLSQNGSLDDTDIQVANFTIGSLPAKTTSSLVVDMRFAGKVPKGTYVGLVMIDTGLEVAESNEANNVGSGSMAGITVLAAAAGPESLTGTESNDVILVSQSGNTLTVQVNATVTTLHSGDVSQFLIEAGGGDDVIEIDSTVATPIYVLGGTGNDTIVGGSASDTLTGAAGKDRIAGQLGNDLLNGSGGSDRIDGGAGADRILGGDGNDVLEGGSSGDRIFAGAGNDNLLGGNGDDYLHAVDGAIDTVTGGAGTDTADEDSQDVLSSIEV
jgi:Ca2+-binding RTX toxin-like protein